MVEEKAGLWVDLWAVWRVDCSDLRLAGDLVVRSVVWMVGSKVVLSVALMAGLKAVSLAVLLVAWLVVVKDGWLVAWMAEQTVGLKDRQKAVSLENQMDHQTAEPKADQSDQCLAVMTVVVLDNWSVVSLDLLLVDEKAVQWVVSMAVLLAA